MNDIDINKLLSNQNKEIKFKIGIYSKYYMYLFKKYDDYKNHIIPKFNRNLFEKLGEWDKLLMKQPKYIKQQIYNMMSYDGETINRINEILNK